MTFLLTVEQKGWLWEEFLNEELLASLADARTNMSNILAERNHPARRA